MGITVSTPASTRRLTRAQTVIDEMGQGDLQLVERLIDQASAAIVRHCRREFARAGVIESQLGNDLLEIQVSRTPISRVILVSFDGIPVTDYTIGDREEGTLYRRAGWEWTAQRVSGLSGHQRFPGFGQALAGREEPLISVSYQGGYILASQSLANVTTLTVDATDNSFNDAASGFPSLLTAGDVLVATGFAVASNNGRFLIQGTPTSGKIVVTADLTAEETATPQRARTITFDPPDECRSIYDVEKACIETVKDYFTSRGGRPLVARQVGSTSEQYQTGIELAQSPLPPLAAALLRSHVRHV